MNRPAGIAIILCALTAAGSAMHAAETQQPNWAYAIPSAPPPPRAPDSGMAYSLPGTDLRFTRDEIAGRNDTPPADWHPGDHPPMPDIVAKGNPSQGVRACAFCHYPNGKGYPGTAGPAALPADYIIQQMHDFRDGLRESAEPRKENVEQMIDIAKGMSEEEIAAAASYYASVQWSPWIRVVETDMVPKSWNRNGMFHRLEGDEAGTEPIGNRILELPEDSERTLLRDSRSGFIAYVPLGTLAKGEELVRTGGGTTIQCTACHGEDLNGIGAVPGIAARSPSYLVRQLYDMQQGTRRGPMAALMQPIVANLTTDDMLNIAAYAASLPATESAPEIP